jgi:mRNA-degrading endonuclease RelE of RelBE toxin-antitoxin system
MVATASKQMDFSQQAYAAIYTLSAKEQKKAMQLIELSGHDLPSLLIENKSYKLGIFDRNIYALKLNAKLRIIVEILDNEVKILDVLNRDLHDIYFKKQ